MLNELIKVFFIFFVFIILLFLFFNFFIKFFLVNKKSDLNINYESILEINGYKINIEVADNFFERSKGLSGKKNLNENEGMLFVFEKPQIQKFWMKDMNFPIDIIWLNKDEVIGYIENVLPEVNKRDFELSIYKSPKAVDKVLELKAGMVKKLDIKIGDKIFFK